MTIIDDYIECRDEHIKKYGAKTTVLMQVGSFFEVYAEDIDDDHIHEITNCLNIILSRKNKKVAKVDRSNPLMAGFPMSMLDKYLETLIRDGGWTVVVIEQVSAAPNPRREITNIWSPATYPGIISKNDVQNILCFCYVAKGSRKIDQFICGLSLLDCSTGTTYIDEFISNKMDILQQVINVNIRYEPKEVILTYEDDYCEDLSSELRRIFGRKSSKLHYYELSYEYRKMKRVKYILEQFFDNTSQLEIFDYLQIERYPYATICIGNLLEFISNHKLSFTSSIRTPKKINTKNTMEVSYNAFDQLNITTGEVSVLSLLNNCTTSIGKRYFRSRLLNPFKTSAAMNDSLRHIEAFQLIDTEFVRSHLMKVKDIEKISFRNNWSPFDIQNMWVSFKSLKTICSVVGNDATAPDEWKALEYIESHFNMESNFHASSQLSSDDHKIFKNTNDDVECSLSRIEELKGKFTEVASVNPEFFKLERNERDGYHLACTYKRYTAYSDALKQCRVIKSNSGGTCKLFIPNEKEYNDEILAKEHDMKTEIQAMFESHCDVLRGLLVEGNFLRSCVELVEHYDFNLTCVENNRRYRLHKPKVLSSEFGNGSIRARGLRHLIVENVCDEVKYVPNDIELDRHGVLLYGVNASGKSCFMKSIAIATILAQSGMWVPATEFTLCPFERIFTRITGNDDLFRKQSTFVLEMNELRQILDKIDDKSLVIGDELCSGTETVSGISIVASAIRRLSVRESCFLFATHLHEVNDLIKETSTKVFHFSVFDRGDGVLIYERKLSPGPGNTMYGLEVCKSLDMNGDFVEEAFQIRRQLLKEDKGKIRHSRYNSNFYFQNECQLCKTIAEDIDIHHVVEQRESDEFGNVGDIHKNDVHNLVALCKACHRGIHKGEKTIRGTVMSTYGRLML